MPVSSIGDILSVGLHSEPAPRVSARLRALGPIDTLRYVEVRTPRKREAADAASRSEV
jgi:hypothetical protein